MVKERGGIDLLGCFDFDVQQYAAVAREILRPELYEVLEQSTLTGRFKRLGLSSRVINKENVYVHILRLLCRVDSLPLVFDAYKAESKKELAIHDLPETLSLRKMGKRSDVTSTEKSGSSTLDQKVSLTEYEAAQELFGDGEELRMYEEFEQASSYLKGRTDETPSGTALICKILDKIDSDLFYHIAASQSIDILKRPRFKKKGQGLAFEQYTAYSERLALLAQTEVSREAELCQWLLDGCMLTIKDIWEPVPKKRIPRTIRQNLATMQLS